jgi:phage protein D
MAEDRVPQFKVVVNGAALTPEVQVDVLSVVVTQYTNGADVFTLEMNNWNSADQTFKWLDSDQFRPGSEVEVKIGYLDDQKSIIKGEITAIEPEFPSDKAPTVKIHGYDRLHRFRRGRKTRSFVNTKDSDVAKKIAQELHLDARVEDTQIVHPYLFQNNVSNIDFLQDRARRIRFEVDVENRTLIFRQAANNSGKVLSLNFGEKLKSFFPRLSTLEQVSEVVVRGWNASTKKAILARGKAGDEVTKMSGTTSGPAVTEAAFFATTTVVADRHLASQSEADQMAKAQFNAVSDRFITGEATVIGNPTLAAGTVVELNKVGKRFSGLYYITAASHVIKQQGYTTLLTVQRNAI